MKDKKKRGKKEVRNKLTLKKVKERKRQDGGKKIQTEERNNTKANKGRKITEEEKITRR